MKNIRIYIDMSLIIFLLMICMTSIVVIAEQAKQQGVDIKQAQEKSEGSVNDSFAQSNDLYNPKNKRDPFRPFIKLIKEEDTGVSDLVPPIKRYQLQEFKLAGVVWVEGEPRAMVIDPEKNTYYLGTGDQIGNREGIIIQISENGMVVEEKRHLEDVFGNKKIEVDKVLLAFQE